MLTARTDVEDRVNGLLGQRGLGEDAARRCRTRGCDGSAAATQLTAVRVDASRMVVTARV